MEQGEIDISEALEYHSHNTTRLDLLGTQQLLLKLPFMEAILLGENVEVEE